jgi:hypothetical protein
MSRYLVEHFEMPIAIVSFEVFDTGDGSQMVIREITEPEEITARSTRESALSVDAVIALADRHAHGDAFRQLLDVGREAGLHVRPYRTSLMFAPQTNRSRIIFTMWAHPTRDKLRLYVSPEAVAEFFPVSAEEAQSFVGANGWRYFTPDEAKEFAAKVRMPFEFVRQKADQQST